MPAIGGAQRGNPHAKGTAVGSLTAPTMGGSLAGILLRPFTYSTKHVDHVAQVDSRGWDVVGWVVAGGTLHYVSLCEHNLQDDGTPAPFDTTADPPPTNEQGLLDWIAKRQRVLDWSEATWREIALLYDGRGISLLIDGRRSTTIVQAVGDIATSDQIRCFIGHLVVGNGSFRSKHWASNEWRRSPPWIDLAQASPPTGGPFAMHADTRIGAVGLMRLVSPEPRQMPNGIKVAAPIDYTVLPTGQVVGATTPLPPLRLTGQFDEADDAATLTINPASGQVTGVLTPSRSAP